MSRPVKTSLTHPLPLPAVTTPEGGVIAMTMGPGKRQPEAVTGPWERDLAMDMDAIAAFGAKTLISLMEASEMAGAQIPLPLIQTAARARGITHLHWPIVDFAAPDKDFETLWQAQAEAVLTELSTGGRVVVHCRGGRGRSGLVAARLMIELGVKPAEAFRAIRAVQPLAIETPVQEEHVLAFTPQVKKSLARY